MEALGFRNFKIVGDAISCTNDATKMDKEGVKCFSKHIYGNDEQWFLCQWTCMGLYCMVNADVLGQMDKFFASADNKYGTDAKKYNEQLNALIVSQPRQEMVSLHVRLDHFNAYGCRKGAASNATGLTTLPPSITALMHRGAGWSMGVVIDTYVTGALPSSKP